MMKSRSCIRLFLYLTLLTKAGDGELIHKHTINGRYTAFARHPLLADSLYAANDEEIFAINMASGESTLLVKLSSGKVDDMELISGSHTPFLLIASVVNDCIHHMDITTNDITHFIGKCDMSAYHVNTAFQNTRFANPSQLAYDASSEILYVKEDQNLVACDLANEWTSEITVNHNSLKLPSTTHFYFSLSSPYNILVNDISKSMITHVQVDTSMTVKSVSLLADMHVTYVADIADVLLMVSNKLLVGADGQQIYDFQGNVKVMTKLNDSTIVLNIGNNRVHIFGSNETATMPSSTTTSPLPTSAVKRHSSAHNGQKRYRFGKLFQNGKCMGDEIKTVDKISVETCGFMCTGDHICMGFSYNYMSSSCYMFTACGNHVSQESTDSYIIAA